MYKFIIKYVIKDRNGYESEQYTAEIYGKTLKKAKEKIGKIEEIDNKYTFIKIINYRIVEMLVKLVAEEEDKENE